LLPLGYRTVAFEAIGSTSDEARRLAGLGAEHGTVVWALEQSAGHGRRGRVWASPPGNLYCSIILRPDCTLAAASELSMVAAVALRDALSELLPDADKIRLKWPNDVLVDGAKIAGMLLECESGQDGRVSSVVLGIGLNLVSSPQVARYPTISLADFDIFVEPEAMLNRVVGHLDRWFTQWQQHGFQPVRAAWLNVAYQLGHQIELARGDEILSGRFADIGQGGALLLESDGDLVSVLGGEWTTTRSAPASGL
jgi:BirA family biotin operon repressor/biotin-[acetyl-CoA-carboxylase] ligase